MNESIVELPAGYYLEQDPDILILRRRDGSMVAVFNAEFAALEAILKAAEEDSHRDSLPDCRNGPASVDVSVRPSLRASFFGRFELFCGEETLTLRRNGKALAILKYLLAHNSRTVSQDHLMEWLWPESNARKARWSLNSAIYVLRGILNECLPSLPPPGYLIFEEGKYRLSPKLRISSDTKEFDARYENGCRLEKVGHLMEAVREYEKAIALYRDDYLVEDLYEDWTMIERERLANAYMDMMGRIAVYYMEVGELRESIRTCYRILEREHCHEDTHRLLITCYLRLGARDRALRQYRLCEEALSRRYGMPPSLETQALHEHLLTTR